MSHYFAFVAFMTGLVLIPVLPALPGITFAALGFASLALYALVLARAGGMIRRTKLTRRLIRGSGGVLVGFGVALVAEQ